MNIRVLLGLMLSAGVALIVFVTPVAAQNSKPAHKVIAPPVGTVPADISPEAAEVVWLYHHNASHGAILHYVNNSTADFKLSVEDVNYLKDIGVTTDVVFAMVRSPKARENVLRLRDREPLQRVSRHQKPEEPETALQNIEFRQNQPTDANPQSNVAPQNSAPANNVPNNVPAEPVPQGRPYYGPPPGALRGYDNRVLPPVGPGYNNGYYNRRYP